jgi:hypothetical protein
MSLDIDKSSGMKLVGIDKNTNYVLLFSNNDCCINEDGLDVMHPSGKKPVEFVGS